MSKAQDLPSQSLPFSYEYSDNKWKLAVGKQNYGRLKGHSLHYIGPYSGSFPPELVHYFLYKYTSPNEHVLDPFSGRGTTGLQAVLNNRQVTANDANPLAYVYTLSKLAPSTSAAVDYYLSQVPFHDSTAVPSLPKKKEAELLAYFHPDTLKELLVLREHFLQDPSPLSRYIQSLLVGTLRGNRISNLSITMSGLICFSANYMRSWSLKTNIYPEYREVVSRLVAKAERLERDGLNFRRDSVVIQQDATDLWLVEDRSVDTIITSPPYFNVINYAYDNRIRLWMLGHEYKDIQQLLCHTSSVPKYTDFLQGSLHEMYRVLRDDSWAIIVVGDVQRKMGEKKVVINTAEIVAHEAQKVGFTVDKIINDALPEQKGTCGRATSLTDRFNVKIDRCVVLAKGNPEERNYPVDWGKLVNPRA